MYSAGGLTRALLAGIGLTLVISAVRADGPSRTNSNKQASAYLVALDPSQRANLSGGRHLPTGIRSFGKGAVRSELPSYPVLEPDRSSAISTPPADGPIAGLTVNTKISGSPGQGSVSAFALSPDGSTAVFIADKEVLGRFELYSVPVDGLASPVKISAGLPLGSGDLGVSAFQINPLGNTVAFLADANSGGGVDDIYSAPIDGSASPVQLNGGAESPITAFGITADGLSVAFLGDDTAFGTGAVEIHGATLGVAGSSAQLSEVGNGNALGDVVSAELSPDGAWVVYAADGTVDGRFEWHSVPIGATGPGSDVQLSAALGSVGLARISIANRVVYTSDENFAGKLEVYSQPITGGGKLQLNPSMEGSGAIRLEVSPDGNWVGYIADQDTPGVTEVYAAQTLVMHSGTRLNTMMGGTQFADTLAISPDSGTVVYEADQETVGTVELFGVAIDAGSAPGILHDLSAPADVGFFADNGTPIIGRRVVYPVFGSTVGLFSVPYDGSASFVQVNPTPGTGDVLFSAFLPSEATRLMAYGAGPSAGTVTDEIRAVAIRGDLPSQQINVTAAAGSLGVLAYEIGGDEAYGVYLQDQDTQGKPELYSRELDSDADGFINALDNCPFIANPSQQPLLFGPTVTAIDQNTFDWGEALDVKFVRGPLSGVGTLAVDESDSLSEASTFSDATVPSVGAGFYYLFGLDCPGGSYQTTLGAEPARDTSGLP